MALITIVAGEGELFEFLGHILQKEGFDVKLLRDAKSLSEKLHRQSPKLVILEDGGILPNVEEMCVRIRNWTQFHSVRILVIGSQSHGNSVPLTCEGADAILSRPLHPRAVVAQVKKLLQGKSVFQPHKEVTVGDLALDPASYRVTRSGHVLRLSVQEFRLLYFLVSHPNTVWSRDQLIGAIWPKPQVTPRTVDVFISRLRKLIEECPEKPVRILSAPGDGYSFQIRTRMNRARNRKA